MPITYPPATVKSHCVSCGDRIPSWDKEIGACDHGLLCNVCRYENMCLQCKRDRDEADELPDEAYDPHDAEDILRYE